MVDEESHTTNRTVIQPCRLNFYTAKVFWYIFLENNLRSGPFEGSRAPAFAGVTIFWGGARWPYALAITSAIERTNVSGSSRVWIKPRLCQKFAASWSIALTMRALPPTSFAAWMQVVMACFRRPEPMPWPEQFLSTAN